MNASEKKKTVIAAVSGGVDSSVAAALCLERGYQVIGVTLRLRSCSETGIEQKSCCGSEDAADARTACRRLGISHHFLDLEKKFEEDILRHAWQAYCCGITPNPCVRCNARLKFGALLDFAAELGAEAVVTGHHARIIRAKNDSCELRRGRDPDKDQSYFLYSIPLERLSKIIFPVGEMTKAEVRNKAASLGLHNAEKAESQDACFTIPGANFPETLCRQFGSGGKAGNFISPDGKILGQHDGIHQYTIGQRRGLGIALGEPGYISEINPETGDITISTRDEDLRNSQLLADEINWLEPECSGREFTCRAQIRYRNRAAEATVIPAGEESIIVKFKQARRAITPGQSVVFYRDDRVLGGGVINRKA